jgi:hypothetical protein
MKSTTTGTPRIRLFSGGVLREGASDYFYSILETGTADIDTTNAGALIPSRSASGSSDNEFTFTVKFFDLMRSDRNSRIISTGSFFRYVSSSEISRSIITSSFRAATELNERFLIAIQGGLIDKGEAYLYRIREPSA